ncbi:SDR family NAD(P)-dependent oxidoreductase [Streptomyces sp. NPDC000405]|uniref:SDR family NAD(P)-dependent oxidoreductase n=1 Tax=Streptomyces sp. NPDC000405 TaxID=3161033 RepID=UPI00398D11B2
MIAIFGAGPGLGVSIAQRFAPEGFRVALVARRKDRLDALVDQLSAEVIDTAGFTADLSVPKEIPTVIEAIRERFGRIDVVEYGPIPSTGFTPAAELAPDTLSQGIPLLVLTPLAVVQSVLPEWTERGDGAFLMTTGATAVHPRPHASGVGPLMAAARNWLYSLNGELAESGIYAGTLSVAAFIGGSEAAEAAGASEPTAAFPVVDPVDLASLYWDMYTKRDRVEEVYPDFKTGCHTTLAPLGVRLRPSPVPRPQPHSWRDMPDACRKADPGARTAPLPSVVAVRRRHRTATTSHATHP